MIGDKLSRMFRELRSELDSGKRLSPGPLTPLDIAEHFRGGDVIPLFRRINDYLSILHDNCICVVFGHNPDIISAWKQWCMHRISNMPDMSMETEYMISTAGRRIVYRCEKDVLIFDTDIPHEKFDLRFEGRIACIGIAFQNLESEIWAVVSE